MIFKKIGNMDNVEVICHYFINSMVYNYFGESLARKILDLGS
jgi:hypothetical protein